MNRVGEEEGNRYEGRDSQRRRVDEANYDKNSVGTLDDDNLEEPVELNFENKARAAAANNQGRGEENRARAPQGPAAAAADNQEGGEGSRAGAPQGHASSAANNQGHGIGNCAGAPQGPAGAANNQGRGGGNHAGAPQGPPGAAGAAAGVAAAVNPINRMEMPFRWYVDNRVQAYESPFNDPTRETAMKSAEAHVISLQHLVDSLNEERQKGEYMVCVMLAITNSGTAQTRGRTNG
jgi:hypothetical protein